MTPEEFIESLEEPRRSDVKSIHEFFRRQVPHHDAYVSPPMLGYGRFHYRYATGREGDSFRYGIANRKTGISIYVVAADDKGYLAERYRDRLSKAKIGKSCIVVKRASDLDFDLLAEMVTEAERIGPAGAA